MNLSKNFTLEEMFKSGVATRKGIDNTTSDEVILGNLKALVQNVWQPVRDYFGPVVVNSAYRCLELNRAIGSKDSSQHVKGEAVDGEAIGHSNYDVAVWIRDNLDFDQLILEFYESGQPRSGWVHCSYKSDGTNRNEVLTINSEGVHLGLIK